MANYSSSNKRQTEVEKDIKNIEEALKSPATPENMKNVFRKQLTQLKDKLDALKSSSGSTYEEELKRQQRSGQAVGQGISLTAMAERMGIPITHVQPPVKNKMTSQQGRMKKHTEMVQRVQAEREMSERKKQFQNLKPKKAPIHTIVRN